MRYEYRWVRGGREIPGETSATYVVRPSDANQMISVQVTAIRNGLSSSVRTPGGRVAPLSRDSNEWTTTPKPSISGSALVNQNLEARMGTWSPSPASIAYQWLSDGVPIAGQTGRSYRIQESDRDKKISLRVTATHPTSGQTQVLVSDPTRFVGSNDSFDSLEAELDGQPIVAQPDSPTFDPGEGLVRPEGLADFDEQLLLADTVEKASSGREILATQQGPEATPPTGIQVVSSSANAFIGSGDSSGLGSAIISLRGSATGITAAVADFFDLSNVASAVGPAASEAELEATRFEDWVQDTQGTNVNRVQDSSSNIVTVTGSRSAYCPANYSLISSSLVEPPRDVRTNNPRGLQFSTHTANLTSRTLVTLSGAQATEGQEYIYTRPNPTAQFSLAQQLPWTPQVKVECEEVPQISTAPTVVAPTRFTVSGTGQATCPGNATFISGRVIIPSTSARGLSYDQYSATGTKVGKSFVARSGVKTVWARNSFFQRFRVIAQGPWTPSVVVTCSR